MHQSDIGIICYYDPTPLGLYYHKNKVNLETLKSIEEDFNRKKQPATHKKGKGEKVFYIDLDNYGKQS